MISANDVNIKYSPYNWDVTAERALTNCGGAMFSTLVTGSPTSIILKFDVKSMSATVPSKIAYRVDGVNWIVEPIKSEVVVTFPSITAKWKTRHLEVVLSTTSEAVDRWNSPNASALKFTGMETTPTTCSTIAIPKKQLSGVIFGDSITEGINTISSGGDATARSDAIQSWAFQVGDTLGAEVGVVGFGRLGMSIAGNGSVPKFPNSWKLLAAGIPRSFEEEPDFIVINLGTNDKNNNITNAVFKADYIASLNAMLSITKNTVIFVMLPFGGHYGAALYKEIVAGASIPARVEFVDTSGWWVTSDAPDNVHPWGYTAPKHATLLSKNISDRLLSAPVEIEYVTTSSDLFFNGSAWV